MKSNASKKKLPICGLAVILCLSFGLTACATVSPASAASRRLYQPPVLRLSAGRPVETQDGLYLPQVNEVWHSDARFTELEARYLDALAALAARKP